MSWIDRAVQVFQIIGFVGLFVGLYTFARDKKPVTLLMALVCGVGALLPMYWIYLFTWKLPHVVINLLAPTSKQGVVGSFLLNVAPWVYLLPAAIPPTLGKKRGRKRA